MDILDFVERAVAYAQGKGYGAATVDNEVGHALALLGRAPERVLDIGANKGLWTQSLLTRHPMTEVDLFEPQPACSDDLTRRYAGRANVRIHALAVAGAAESRRLYFDKVGSGLASLSKRKLDHLNIDFDKSVPVQTTTIDGFLSGVGNPPLDIVKLDIEGHELDALCGMQATLAGERPPRVIQFEFGGCNIDTRTYFRDFYHLLDASYRFHRQTPFGLKPVERYRESYECFRTTNYFLRLRPVRQG